MNWWLLRRGTTRSHSELGRETCPRQWYFGLSRGRVGNCQFFHNPNTPYSILLFNSPPYRGVFFMQNIVNIINFYDKTLLEGLGV